MPDYFISQSTSKKPLHCAVIMDGNGRWAAARGLPRIAGHRAGAAAVRRATEAAPDEGIGILTLYAFSSDNWRRPPVEVEALMDLLGDHLRSELDRCLRNGVRVKIIGRRDRLRPALVRAIEDAEFRTAGGERLLLRIAVDYSARDAIAQAASAGATAREEFASRLGPEVDLLIRTGGERRLSDFLLWECAYAELIFTPRMWPDFDAKDLAAAVRDYRSRERRFGAVPAGNGHARRAEAWLD